MKKYYTLWFQLNQVDMYSIWYTNDIDGVVINNDGKMLVFLERSRLYDHIKDIGFQLVDEEPILHNLDTINQWTEDPQTITIDCSRFLAAWNLFNDLASSIEDTIYDKGDDLTNKVYEKLFRCSNLPSVTPPEQTYRPTWKRREVMKLQEVLYYGFKMFQDHIAVVL